MIAAWRGRLAAAGLALLAACGGEETVAGGADAALPVADGGDDATAAPVDTAGADEVATADAGTAETDTAETEIAPPGGERGSCDPCAASSECSGVGAVCAGLGDPAGASGQFCLPGCGEGVACPPGSTCTVASTAEGTSALACVPTSGACGCGAAAQAAGWSTPCFRVAWDGQGVAQGVCKGTFSCSTGACDAPQPVTETCNGADDDCDGQTDEADVPLCDDGDPCTAGDACQAGTCVTGSDTCGCHADADCAGQDLCGDKGFCDKSGLPWVCASQTGTAVQCPPATACAVPTCNPATGLCEPVPLADATPCDADGNPCTAGDACAGGKCLPGKAPPCDDGNPCTFDGCDAVAGCSHLPQLGACDDGNACTSGDACQGGVCQPGAAKACGDGDPCTADGCDALTGTCSHGPAAAGTACDDGDACTVADACGSAGCQGSAQVCTDGDPCTDDGCGAQGTCQHTPNQAPCDDGNPCTTGDACVLPAAGQAGGCQGGAGTCDCQVDADCAGQGNPCLGQLVCAKTAGGAKACAVKAGTAVVCPPGKPGACTANACDPATGACQAAPVPDGKACDDGDGCSAGDVCLCAPGAPGGATCQCQAGQTVPCDDGNPCTQDSCQPAAGCQHQGASGSCEDGNPCTVGDACQAGKCKAGGAKACGDGNPCTADSCDAATGACVAKGLTGSGCDVGCGAGTCQAGTCVAAQGACDDGNPCTADSCVAGQGCQHAAQPGTCSDGDACTGGDGCAQGKCVPGKPISCDDGNACTADACLPASGCSQTATTAACDDQDACTEGDACSGGACAGKAKDCADGNACTVDTCLAGVCQSDAKPLEAKACPPGPGCNGAATCQAGTCVDPAGSCPFKPGAAIWPPQFPAKLGPAKTFYDPVGVHTVALTVDPAAWAQYLAVVAAKGSDVYYEADVAIDGVSYAKVGIRPFGYGSLGSNPQKPNVRITFDHFVAKSYGPGKLKNVRLKASGQDRTFLRQPIAQSMTQQAGGHAPRFSWARLTVNGAPYGLYQVLEYADKRMFSANFGNNDGNEYDRKKTCVGLNCPGGDCSAIKAVYKGAPGDGAEIEALATAVAKGPADGWLAQAEKAADLETLLALYAVEAITSDIDGLAAAGQNFVMYVDEDSNRLKFIQTGPDLSLGNKAPWYDVMQPWGPPNTWCKGRKDDFFLRMLQTAELKAKYLAKVKQLHCGLFAAANLVPVIEGYRKLLYQDLYFDPKGKIGAAEIDKAYTTLVDFVTQRNQQLAALVGPCP